MGQIVNRGFQPDTQSMPNPSMGGIMQDPSMPAMQPQAPTAYGPSFGTQESSIPLSSIPQGAADEGHMFAQQASMFRDANSMNRMQSPYDDSGDLGQSLGNLLGMNQGNPVYDQPYGNSEDMMYGNSYGGTPLDFPESNDTQDVYGSYSRPTNLGSIGEY